MRKIRSSCVVTHCRFAVEISRIGLVCIDELLSRGLSLWCIRLVSLRLANSFSQSCIFFWDQIFFTRQTKKVEATDVGNESVREKRHIALVVYFLVTYAAGQKVGIRFLYNVHIFTDTAFLWEKILDSVDECFNASRFQIIVPVGLLLTQGNQGFHYFCLTVGIENSGLFFVAYVW